MRNHRLSPETWTSKS